MSRWRSALAAMMCSAALVAACQSGGATAAPAAQSTASSGAGPALPSGTPAAETQAPQTAAPRITPPAGPSPSPVESASSGARGSRQPVAVLRPGRHVLAGSAALAGPSGFGRTGDPRRNPARPPTRPVQHREPERGMFGVPRRVAGVQPGRRHDPRLCGHDMPSLSDPVEAERSMPPGRRQDPEVGPCAPRERAGLRRHLLVRPWRRRDGGIRLAARRRPRRGCGRPPGSRRTWRIAVRHRRQLGQLPRVRSLRISRRRPGRHLVGAGNSFRCGPRNGPTPVTPPRGT